MTEKIIFDTNTKKLYTTELLKLLWRYQDEKVLSKKELAEAVGVNFLEIYRWKKGQSIPRSMAILQRIAGIVSKK